MKQQIITFVKRNKIQVGILLFFLVWMLFIDEFNWFRIHRDKSKLKALKEEREYLIDKIETDRNNLQTLQSNTKQLEKFAREQYLLKKENEEIYIILEE